jgi:hypothetical protein
MRPGLDFLKLGGDGKSSVLQKTVSCSMRDSSDELAKVSRNSGIWFIGARTIGKQSWEITFQSGSSYFYCGTSGGGHYIGKKSREMGFMTAYERATT